MKYQTNVDNKSEFLAQVADHEDQDNALDNKIRYIGNSPKIKRGLAAMIADKRRKHKLYEKKAVDDFSEAIEQDGSINNEEDRQKQIEAVENETKATTMLGDLAVKLGQLDTNFISEEAREQLKDDALTARDSAEDLRDSMRASKVQEYSPVKADRVPVNEIANIRNGKRTDRGEEYVDRVRAKYFGVDK